MWPFLMKRLIISVFVSSLFYVMCLFPSHISHTGYGRVQGYDGGYLVEYISSTFKRPYWEVQRIVRAVYFQVGESKTFPTAMDILAVMGVESSFDPNARGEGGLGLMQINPSVHKIENLGSISVNVINGIRILDEYRNLSKSDDHALVYYNAGPSGGRSICPDKTCNAGYVQKVKRLRKELEKAAKKQPAVCSRMSSVWL